MSQPLTIFDSQQPVMVRLVADVATALGVPDADVPLRTLMLQGGMLLAEFAGTNNQVTRYLLPPGSIRYARQVIQQAAPPPPPQGG